ncbi:MAG: discoidin domain-containing protein [Verrucomicrobiota bacterium]
MKKLLSVSIAAAIAMAASATAGEKALALEFPPPFLTGTPVPVNLPHLEPTNTPPPVIMVPAGVTNIAEGLEVTSSDDFPIIGDLELITDGDKESEEGYFVELAPGIQWVQIDFGSEAEFYGAGLWHFHSQKRAYHDVIVQVSNDESFESGVTTLFNNDHDNSSEMGKGSDAAYLETNKGKLIDLKKAKGQYIRLYSAGNTSNEMNHYVELEVFGKL